MRHAHLGERPTGGSAFSRWIESRGLSRQAVAAELGIPPERLDALCDAAKRPSIPLAYRIEALSNGEITVGSWFETAAKKDR